MLLRMAPAIILACTLHGFSLATWADDVIVTQAWISAAPPVVRMNAGYLRVENKGTSNLILSGAESPRFARIEMHRSEMHDGVYSMQRQYSLVLAGGQSISFAPGGLHLMLFGSDPAPRPNEIIPLTLIFADGQRVPVKAEVRPPQSGAGRHHH